MADQPTRRVLASAAVLWLVVALVAPAPVGVAGSAEVGAAGHGVSPGWPAGDGAVGADPSGHRSHAADGTTGSSRASEPGDGEVAAAADRRFGRSRRGEPSDAGRAGYDGSERRVTLVTGETVAVYGRGDDRSFEVVSGGPVHAVSANGRTYLLPEGVDPGTYDRSLFDVDALLSASAEGDGLPVLLDTDASPSSIDADGLRDVRRLRSAGVVAAELDPVEAEGTIASLVADGRVRSVSLDRRIERPSETVPNAATPEPGRNVTGEGVTIAVLDTGIDASHPDLAENVVEQVDLVDGDAGEGGGHRSGSENESAVGDGGTNAGEDGADEPGPGDVAPDLNGHGTHVAGVLAGTGGEGGDHAGVAPDADLVDVRVMNDRGSGSASTIIEGIEYAVERDVDVVLLSVGTSIDGGDAIADSVEWAADRGVVVVAAAGNGGTYRTIGAPGRPAGAITVGATDGDGRVASYSSRGPTLVGDLKPDLVAPGRGIVGARSSGSGRVAYGADGRYTQLSGTSAAAPQVAGAAALLLESEPGLSAREIEARLGSAARPVDGGGAYAQGSGELDVDGALDPDVVVSDPAVDFGLLDDDGTVNRTITVANHGDRRHELTFDVAVHNVDRDVAANETASLNRSALSLAPGERANLTLSVDGDTASGAHAGEIRYAVAGEPRSLAFGFVRGGTVTVEKQPYSAGARVDGDPLWVLTEEGTHDELLEFENGTASFVAGGGTYLLWSWGTDEPTGTQAFLSERRTVDGPEHVVLDERDTVPVGVDAGRLVDRHGRLTNRSVTVSVSTAFGDGLTKLSVSKRDTDSRAVRVSPDPELSVATAYLLTTEPRGSAALDVAEVFQLAHGVEEVRGPSVVEVDPDRLETVEHRFHRATVDETYRVQDRVAIDGVWNRLKRQWFDLGSRTSQRVHRFPSSATYDRAFRGDGWSAHRQFRGDTAENWSADVLSHPMHGLVAVRVENGTATVSGAPFSDGSGTRFDPPGDHHVTVAVDGDVRREERIRRASGSADGIAIGAGEDLAVRLVGNHSGGFLSTRTLTEVTLAGYDPAGERRTTRVNRPPIVTNVSVRGTDLANAVEPGEVTAVYEVDAVGPVVDPVVWYSPGDPEEPPWENGSAWRRAETDRLDDEVRATFRVGEAAETVSLAAAFRDVRGHRTRTMTVDAAHVGEAPNTSSSVLGGRLLAADGTAAANDTVVVAPVDGGSTRYVSTDGDGRFAVELPRGRSYDLTYVRGEPWVPSEPTADDRPAWLPLARVDTAEDVDLGNRSLPEAGDLVVEVTDERGEPVAGASVRVTQGGENVTASETLVTAEDGLATRRGNEAPGIELGGTVEVTVAPPDDGGGLYPEQVLRRTVAVDDRRAVNLTVETAPPNASLAAFGTFEAGEPVFLHARGSEVPAGAAEYRWDVDGDGAADRVTGDPIVRYVPDDGTLRPTVTVVDEAGKTSESTMTLRIRGNETEG